MEKVTKQKPVVAALLIATFLTAIEGTIVSTAMPKIVDDLGGSHLYTWVISVYLLALVISTPIFGKLADLYGRKPMFTIGAIIFLIGSMLSGTSMTMEHLILYRVIQGLGAGALATIPFTIIGDVFEFKMRAKMQGLISSVWGIAGIVGPLAGGLIVDKITWHWIFFLNLPFGIAALVLLWTSLHETVEKKKHTIDYAGILTFALTMTVFLLALNQLKETGHLSVRLIGLFTAAAAGLALFFWIERRSKEPMLPLTLFKNPFIAISNGAGFLLGFILVTVTFYIPLWVQGVTGLNATSSGIAMLPMSVTWPIASMLSGRWMSKRPIAHITILGVGIIFAATLGFTLFDEQTTVPRIMINTAVTGLGFGLTFTAFTVAVQSSVGWNVRGAAMGSHNLMKSLGQVIGISVSGLLLSEKLQGPALQHSLHSVYILVAVLAVCAFGVTAFLLKQNETFSKDA